MPSSVVGALRVILSLDSAEFEAGTKEMSARAKTLNRDLTTFGREATAVGSTLTKAITLPILGIGAAAVKSAMDFESAFSGVRKTVDATPAELDKISASLRDMSKEIPISAVELSNVAAAAGALGIKKDDITDFTRVMATLGVTTNLTSEEAATATAQFQNIFGAAGKDVDKFASTLVALGNDGASTEKQILEMGVRIAGAGKQVGLSQTQVLAFSNALASIGINAEAGGSAMSRVLLKINDAVSKGGSGLAEFSRVAGMSAADFRKAWETDAAGATVKFIEGLNRLKGQGENINQTIEGLVGKNIILKSTLMSAAGAGDLFARSLKVASDAAADGNAHNREATERYKTLESQLTLLWNRVKDVAITLGTSLLPTLKDMVTIATPVVTTVGHLAEKFADLPDPIRLGVLGFSGLAAAIGPMTWAFGQLAKGAGTLIGAFKEKGIIMRLIKADYAALAVSVRGLVAAYLPLAAAIGAVWGAWKIGNTETVKNSVAEWGLASENLTARLYRAIAGLEKMTPEQARAAVAATAAAEAAQQQAAAMDKSTEAASEFIGPLQDLYEGTRQYVEQTEEAKKKAEAFAKSLRSFGGADAMAGAQEVIKQLAALGGPMNVLPSKLDEMANKLRDAAEAAMLMGKVGLADQYTRLANTLDPIIQFQQRYNVTIGEYVTQAPLAATWTEELVDQLNRLGGTVTTIGPKLKSSLDLSKLIVPLKEAVKELSKEGESAFSNLVESFNNLGPTILSAIQGGGSWVSAVGSSLGMGIGKDLQKSLGGFLKSSLGEAIGGALSSFLPGLGAMLGPALSALGGGLKKLFGIGVNDEVKKANAEIGKLQDGLVDTFGSMENLEAAAQRVGLSFAENWGHQGKAGLQAFKDLVDEFNRRWDELDAKREALVTASKAAQGDIDSLIGKADEMGYRFNAAGEFIGVNFDTVKAKAEEFGVSIDGLGSRFAQQEIDGKAQHIIDSFTLLAQAGGDVGGILFGMKDEIGKLVGESVKFGTTIPKNMEPWVKELIRTGQLTDENGEAITDLSKIQFGGNVTTQFEDINNALLDAVNKLNDILSQIAAIPTDRTMVVKAVYDDPGPPQGFGDPNWGGDRASAPGFDVGTLGRLGQWFGNFPKTGMAAVLHGAEAVITPGQALPFAMDVLGSMGRAGNAAGDANAIVESIQRLERSLAVAIPSMVEIAARHGAQTAGRARR